MATTLPWRHCPHVYVMKTLSEDKYPVICIPIPSDMPIARGLFATTSMKGNVKVRISVVDRELIEEEAKHCGLESTGSFIRWCAVNVAKRLRERRLGRDDDEDEYNTEERLDEQTDKRGKVL